MLGWGSRGGLLRQLARIGPGIPCTCSELSPGARKRVPALEHTTAGSAGWEGQPIPTDDATRVVSTASDLRAGHGSACPEPNSWQSTQITIRLPPSQAVLRALFHLHLTHNHLITIPAFKIMTPGHRSRGRPLVQQSPWLQCAIPLLCCLVHKMGTKSPALQGHEKIK